MLIAGLVVSDTVLLMLTLVSSKRLERGTPPYDSVQSYTNTTITLTTIYTSSFFFYSVIQKVTLFRY